jgi:hypothetical protein
MAGWYDDDEPRSPWRVCLYLDERANHEQQAALAAIFLGRAGGTALRNFAAAIGTVRAVRAARVELSHLPRRWSMRADTYLTVRAETPVDAPALVACGIPGLDRPGREVIAGTFRVNDAPSAGTCPGAAALPPTSGTAGRTDTARTSGSHAGDGSGGAAGRVAG